MRILYIGDYYPFFSYKSKMNELIIEKLKKKGHDIVLLSKSWCNVKENSFYGSVEKLTCNYPFAKRYFIDPIQVRNSNINIINAYIGLGCKVIEREKIEKVIFADDIIYTPIIECFKNRYNISYDLFCMWEESFRWMLDDYIRPYIDVNLNIFEKIFTYPFYKFALEHFFNVEERKIVEVKFLQDKNMIENENPKIDQNTYYLYCEDCSEVHLKEILTLITKKDIVKIGKINLVWASNYNLEDIVIGDIHYNKVMVEEIPENAIVLFDKDLIGRTAFNCSYITTCLTNGIFPVIKKEQLQGFEHCPISYKNCINTNEYCIITKLQMSDNIIYDFY